MTETNVIDRLVKKFGSQAALAEAARVKQPTVAGWKKTGCVPARRQRLLLDKAEEMGIQLNAEDLIMATPALEDAASH